jgi:hypothetical protein
MGIYKNDYTKEEDQMLWEIHEIRHQLQEEYKGKSVKEINDIGMKILEEWKSQYLLVNSDKELK